MNIQFGAIDLICVGLMICVLVLSFALYQFINKYVEMNASMIATLSDVKQMLSKIHDAADSKDENWEKRFETIYRYLDGKMEVIQKLVRQ